MIGMMMQVQVSGTELKVRIEKALTEKSLKKLITNLEKELNGEHTFLPREQKQQLVENFLDALPTFEALREVLDTLPKNTNLMVKQIRSLVKRYLSIASRLQSVATHE
jgi:Mor family transcriptional regulator